MNHPYKKVTMSEEEFVEEEELVPMNAFQQYKHTVKLAKTTSRTKNKDWYRDPLELELQVHCYIATDKTADCYLHIKSQRYYEELGQLHLDQLDSDEAVEAWVRQILSLPQVAGIKPKSLGIVCYIADEISLAGLGPEHRDVSLIDELRERMEVDPKEVLEDKTVSEETHSWKLFPYPGAKEGSEYATAVAVSKKWHPLLQRMREYGDTINFPIRTKGLSAPLCAIASLPWCAAPSDKGVVAIFTYAKFTLLTLFNASSDLMIMRHIPHAQGASLPRNLGPTVFSAATAYELENPEVYVFPLLGQSVEGVIISLQTVMKESDIMLVETSDILTSLGITTPIPLEMLTATQQMDPSTFPLAGNHTFSEFREKNWVLQDFLAPDFLEANNTPDEQSMKLLKLSRILKMVAALVFIGVTVNAGLKVWSEIMSDEWQFKSQKQKAQTMMLQKKIKDYKRWSTLLSDRSKGWVVMEFISRFTPADGSVKLEGVEYSIKPTELGGKKKKKTGLEKEWRIQGLANDKGLEYLEAFNTRDVKKMRQLFAEVARETKNPFYDPSVKGRDISVQFTRKRVAGRNNRERGALPYQFNMTIRQTFSAKDPITLNSVK